MSDTTEAARIQALEAQLRTVQNAAKTIAAAQGTELQHLRENARFDHKLRAEHESLKALNSQLTDNLLAVEVDLDRLAALVKELVEGAAKAADYLEALEGNLKANDADMMLDDCLPPSSAADDLRALITRARATGDRT